jgi:hypothetical protein
MRNKLHICHDHITGQQCISSWYGNPSIHREGILQAITTVSTFHENIGYESALTKSKDY